MATNRYTVQCESCEADVTLKTSAAGTKVDCPKCKYRFVAPRAPAAADDPPPAKGGKDGAKKSAVKKGKKKAGNPTVMIGGLLGVLAVAVLAAGGYVLFGGDGDDSPPRNASNNRPNHFATGPDDDDPDDGTPGTDPGTTPGVTGPGPEPGPPPIVPPRPASALLEPTNLLPGEATAILRVNVPRFAETPFFGGVFDSRTRDLFRSSMGFEVDLVNTFIHCRVGAGDEPFSLIRTNSPINELDLYKRMKVDKPADSPINSRHYFTILSSPFIEAVIQRVPRRRGLRPGRPWGRQAREWGAAGGLRPRRLADDSHQQSAGVVRVLKKFE